MNLRAPALTAALLAGLATFGNAAEYLMIPDSSSTTGRRVMLFSPIDGSLVSPNFINLNALTGASTPKHALQVGGEIWVSDQVADRSTSSRSAESTCEPSQADSTTFAAWDMRTTPST